MSLRAKRGNSVGVRARSADWPVLTLSHLESPISRVRSQIQTHAVGCSTNAVTKCFVPIHGATRERVGATREAHESGTPIDLMCPPTESGGGARSCDDCAGFIFRHPLNKPGTVRPSRMRSPVQTHTKAEIGFNEHRRRLRNHVCARLGSFEIPSSTTGSSVRGRAYGARKVHKPLRVR